MDRNHNEPHTTENEWRGCGPIKLKIADVTKVNKTKQIKKT